MPSVSISLSTFASKAKEAMNKLGFIAHCPNCYAIESKMGLINTLTKQCLDCQNKNRLLGGPLWLGDIYDEDFVRTYIENCINSTKPKSKPAIQKFLYQKGAQRELIQQVFDEKYTNEVEINLIRKLYKKNKSKNIISYLHAKGFSTNAISAVVDTTAEKD